MADNAIETGEPERKRGRRRRRRGRRRGSDASAQQPREGDAADREGSGPREELHREGLNQLAGDDPDAPLDRLDELDVVLDENRVSVDGESPAPAGERSDAEREPRRRRRRRGGRGKRGARDGEGRREPAAGSASGERRSESRDAELDNDEEDRATDDGMRASDDRLRAVDDDEDDEDQLLAPIGGHDDEDDSDDDHDFKAQHRGIPSWDEAIGLIVAANMEARARNPSGPSGGQRGRRGQGRGRGRN